MAAPLDPSTLEHTYASALPHLSLAWRAELAPAPEIVVLDEGVAAGLGTDPDAWRTPEGVRWLVGDVGETTPTYAQAYAGHQFGGYSPRLGDGRALLLGEVVTADGRRRDLHLKGSGRTPFARGGDGRAVLGPMLREHLMGEAMHALGIPTTRALAVTTTGTRVLRDGRPRRGAVLARVAASHLRVGTFQYAAATGGPEQVRALADYAIARHHPQAAEAARPYLALFESVVGAQARLVAAWMSVGFVHGVMNTDNMTISGETIDYGPCAFMGTYDPAAVFSSIDHAGRYAYGNQPAAAQWNLARFAETLVPLLADDPDAAVDDATAALSTFSAVYEEALVARLSTKLGLPSPDAPLVADLLRLLAAARTDLTSFFRRLATSDAAVLDTVAAQARPDIEAWLARRAHSLTGDSDAVAAAMNAVNPVYVPRNHRVEEALDAAEAGDTAPFERLVAAVRSPFVTREDLTDLAEPAPADAPAYVTYCGT